MSRGNINNNKKSKGKQKIEIKYIEKEEARLAAFEKRQAGIIKKANELATLTGSQVALVMSSPTRRRKPYSFGHPSTNTVIKRFLGHEEERDIADLAMEAKQMVNNNALSEQLDKITKKVNQEIEKGKKLKEQIDNEEVEAWWTTPTEQLDQEGLVEIEDCYKKLLAEVFSKFQEKTQINSRASSSSSSSDMSTLPMSADSVLASQHHLAKNSWNLS